MFDVPKRVVILGAGPSGLSVAWQLLNNEDFKVTILESEKEVGGLAKTLERDGIKFDIGPHRISPQLPDVLEKIKDLLDKDLLKKENTHGVYFNGIIYNYPPNLSDFSNLSSLKTSMFFGASWIKARIIDILKDILHIKKKKSFENTLRRHFGNNFCNTVIFPMINKVWGTNDLDPEFAKIRFKLPTFSRIIGKIFIKKPEINNSVFYYPVKGFSQIWDELAHKFKNSNIRIELEVKIIKINAQSLHGPYQIIYFQNNEKKTIPADIIVSTISNRFLIRYLADTKQVNTIIPKMEKFNSRVLRLGVIVVKDFSLPTRVIIVPESKFIFNRVSEMNKFSDLGYAPNHSILMADVICDENSTFDTMGEQEFNECLLSSILQTGWFTQEDVIKIFSVKFTYSYPVLTSERYEAQEVVNEFFKNSNIFLCGREASSDYNNAHNAMSKGFLTAEYFCGKISLQEYEKWSNIIGTLPIQD